MDDEDEVMMADEEMIGIAVLCVRRGKGVSEGCTMATGRNNGYIHPSIHKRADHH